MFKYVIAILFFAFFISLNQIFDFDIWFYLKDGEYIVQNKIIPTIDPFSFTATATNWKIFYWLSAVIYFFLFKLSGFSGLIIFNSLALVITFLFVFKTCLLIENPKGNNALLPYIGFSATIISVFICKYRFAVRAYIFSFLLFSIFLYLIRLYKLKGRNFLWLAPIIMIPWCNLHYGYIFGIGILLIFSIGEISKWIGKLYFGYSPSNLLNSRKIVYISLICLSCFLTSLINPYGWHLPLYGFELHNVLLTFPIMEHLKTILQAFPLFIISTAILFTLFLLTIKELDFSEFLVTLCLLYIALSERRFIPEFIIFASPLLAWQLYVIIRKFITKVNQRTSQMFLTSSFIITAIILIPNIAGKSDFGLGVKKGAFPEKAVKFLKENHVNGNLFNPYHFGGYLNWSLFPQNRIFVDGRLVFYGSNTLQKFNEITTLSPLWQELLTETGVDLVIFTESPLLNGLRGSKSWVLIYWDDLVSIYIRNIPANKEIISKYEYKYINPNDKRLSYLNVKNKVKINQTICDIKKKLLRDNECSLAHLLLAVIYSKENKPEIELNEYLNAIKIEKNLAIAWNNAGACFSKSGDKKKAMQYYKKAIKLSPYMNEPYFNIGEIYHKTGNFKKAYKFYKKALKYNNNDYNAHNNLGSIYMSWNKIDDADIEFRTAIWIDQQIPDAWYNIACLNALKGNLVGFTYYFKKAILLNDDKTKYINMAKGEPCFDKIRDKMLFKKLTKLPWLYGKQTKKNIT